MQVCVPRNLHQLLWELNPKQRRVIQLRFWENYTIAEIARELRTSWDETDKLIERILWELRSKLDNFGKPERLYNQKRKI